MIGCHHELFQRRSIQNSVWKQRMDTSLIELVRNHREITQSDRKFHSFVFYWPLWNVTIVSPSGRSFFSRYNWCETILNINLGKVTSLCPSLVQSDFSLSLSFRLSFFLFHNFFFYLLLCLHIFSSFPFTNTFWVNERKNGN